MKRQGTVVRWHDDRGFGFIRSSTTAADVFFHVRDVRGGTTPREGLAVTFEEIHVGGKGPRAMAVQAATALQASARAAASARSATRSPLHRRDDAAENWSGAGAALPLMLGYAAILGWAVLARDLPWWVLPASGFVNLVAFWMYWMDKHSAQQRRWRTSEATLHLWSLVGGWGGAWFAQQVHRHKTRKDSFRQAYWCTVVLHCAALGTWIWWLHR